MRWRGARWVFVLLLMGSAATQAQPAARPDVQAGVSVRPDTVTVGDPFTVTARVRVPAGARIEWPTLDDTAATMAPRAPMRRRDGPSDGARREEIAEWQVAAWDTGQLATEWPPALVIVGADTVPVRLADARVYVRSVLSADTAEHIPRPAKPPFARVVPWWERWWPALLGLTALALLLWWRARRSAPAVAAFVSPRLGPYEQAMAAFDRLDRLALTEAGEHGRAVTLAADIVRTYLLSRTPRASLAQTSAELLASVVDDARIPAPALVSLLVGVDAVKYARRPLDIADVRALVAEAKALVEQVERAEAPSDSAELPVPMGEPAGVA